MFARTLLRYAFALGMGCCLLTAAEAAVTKADKADKTEKAAKKADKKTKEPKASGAVGEFLSLLEDENVWVGEKPAIDAEFYIYLTSASWCEFCNKEMPEVVEAYKKMQADGRVQLIQISGDRTKEAAEKFAEKYKAEFPVLNPNGVTEKLPGYNAPEGLPDAIFVDADGNVIKKGSGSLIKSWEANTVNHPDYANKSKAGATKRKAAKDKKAAERKGGAVLAALKALKPFNGKVNAKADYFVYLQTDGQNENCNAETMAKVADIYKEMKKSGRVEMVIICLEATEEEAKSFLRKHKLKNPAVMDQNEKIEDLPGLTGARVLPLATFVGKDGKVHMEGGMSVLEQWENYTVKRRENFEKD